jgi:ABC-type nitrate/sulfonate/bicarbonate transport system ATPase subunit
VKRRASGKELRKQALRFLQLVGVEDCATQLPGELSQGTQQRVSIARAMALEPRFLLLDEPFGMLDSLTRFELQDMLLDVWEKDRKTVVMVTHDVDEALYLSDRIVLMTDGPEARIGEIMTVPFNRPRDRVAVLESKEYYRLHARIIDFLENHSAQFAV